MFSSESDKCPSVGIGPLLQFPDQSRAGPVLLTLLFLHLVPSSYWVLHGSVYSFPLVRYSCPLSVGVLHALLCLKVYSWCIREERCTPHPPTPPPSCSPILVLPSLFFRITPVVIRMSEVYHLFSSLHSVNYFHFCFHHYCLLLLSIASYITTAFTLASRNPGLEIEILYLYSLYSTVQ